ncbi:MAG: nuclear transport factor 2 family protein [Acidimicrobiales bacterium]
MLAELVDRQRIADLLARYCERLDEYDIDGVAEVFTDDGVTDYAPGRGGRVVGRDAVRDRIAQGQASFRRTSHQLGQSLVDIDGAVARATTYVTAWHEWEDGSQDALRLRYLDELRRQPDGNWLISQRRLEAMGVEGFEGTEWAWVKRGST